MERENSLPCSQESATGSSLDADESSLHYHTFFILRCIWILSSYLRLSFQVFGMKLHIHFLISPCVLNASPISYPLDLTNLIINIWWRVQIKKVLTMHAVFLSS